MDPFYGYGFAFPVWNSVDAGKAIIYGTKNHLTQNFVVNLAWIVGGTIALLSVSAYKRKSQDKQEYMSRVEEVKEKRSEAAQQRHHDDNRPQTESGSREHDEVQSDDSSDATRNV